MEVELLTIPKRKAASEYKAYKEELQRTKTQLNRDMLALYAHMRHGGKVIDVWEAMKIAGLNDVDDPKLAIVRADSKRVRFERCFDWVHDNVSSRYVSNGGIFYRFSDKKAPLKDVEIPKSFFPEWIKNKNDSSIRRTVETVVPIIPARIMNPLRSHKLENYHILWEVEKWELVPPIDPILLKRITPNMSLVLATWNLSKLERAVIRGRI